MSLLIYSLIPLIFIRSCQSGSSSSSSSSSTPDCPEQPKVTGFWRIVKVLSVLISFLCSLDGIWNTISSIKHQYGNLTAKE
ncbi:unnamed protein product [Schistosoma turkestanicum]|nr:unnamed protein product [Schistosoma turkestanicum]